ncbi:MAG: KEOPS complex subunit Pcc1 [Candidatus Bathyarchaeia archaeon]
MNILRAIEPESKSRLSGRSRVHVTNRGNVVLLNITARDTTALRAIVNSYGRWIVSLMRLLPQTQK